MGGQLVKRELFFLLFFVLGFGVFTVFWLVGDFLIFLFSPLLFEGPGCRLLAISSSSSFWHLLYSCGP